MCCWYVGQVISSQAAQLPDKEAIKLESKIDLRNTSLHCVTQYCTSLHYISWISYCDAHSEANTTLYKTNNTLQLLGLLLVSEGWEVFRSGLSVEIGGTCGCGGGGLGRNS